MFESDTGFIAEWRAESGWDDILVGPQGEPVDAAFLTLRHFMQDNDRVSIRRIASMYESEPEFEQYREKFEEITHLNQFLGQ